MKSTTFIAILLTLLTLLLIVGAAALFLLQGRQDLQRDLQLQQSEIEGHTQTIIELQTTAAAREMTIATSEAALATGTAEFSQNRDMLATREANLAQTQAELEALQATTTAQPPQPANGPPPLEILHPQFGASVTTDAILPLIVIASASEGVERLEVQVGDRAPFVASSSGESFVVFRRTVSLSNQSSGALVITARLTTSDGRIEEQSVEIFVNDNSPE